MTPSSQTGSTYVPPMAPQQVTTPSSAAPTTGRPSPDRVLSTPVEVEPRDATARPDRGAPGATRHASQQCR